VRDKAILAALYGGGLRRAELVSLDVDDWGDGELRVLGKGNKERRVPLSPPAAACIDAWCVCRGRQPGALFVSLRRSRRVRMADSGVYAILMSLADLADVERFSPHDLRRTYVSELLDAGVDLATAQALAGHADPATTARYDRRGKRAQREAAARLPFPVAS
jgi:site-specific recombinase XerD